MSRGIIILIDIGPLYSLLNPKRKKYKTER